MQAESAGSTQQVADGSRQQVAGSNLNLKIVTRIHLEPVEMLKCRYMTGIYTCHMTTYDVYLIYTRHIPII
jgi:hypothetical protein